jgi:hypothetical protein
MYLRGGCRPVSPHTLCSSLPRARSEGHRPCQETSWKFHRVICATATISEELRSPNCNDHTGSNWRTNPRAIAFSFSIPFISGDSPHVIVLILFDDSVLFDCTQRALLHRHARPQKTTTLFSPVASVVACRTHVYAAYLSSSRCIRVFTPP